MNIGFSTGALAKSDYRKALEHCREEGIKTVELSALRLEELEPLVRDLDHLGLGDFDYVSLHAPSAFPQEKEKEVIELLDEVWERDIPIIVHPDVIYDCGFWRNFGDKLLVENMDIRKSTGRNVEELWQTFNDLPEAGFCLDLAHARHFDPTLDTLKHLILCYAHKIEQIHISCLDDSCSHKPLFEHHDAVKDYIEVLDPLRPFQNTIATIIESPTDHPLEKAVDHIETCYAYNIWRRIYYSPRSIKSNYENRNPINN